MAAQAKRAQFIHFAKDNAHITQLNFISEDPDGFTYEEIGECAFINYLYRAQSADRQHSVVLKYGELQMKRGNGEEFPLARQQLEYDTLILLSHLLPIHVVRPFCFDEKHHIIALEDLSDMPILSAKILSGDFSPARARRIGEVLAQLHMQTCRDRVETQVWQQWGHTYGSPSAGTVFLLTCIERIFQPEVLSGQDPIFLVTESLTPRVLQAHRDNAECGYTQTMAAIFANKQCLMQADCHPNAIFVKGDQIKLVDMELVGLCDPAVNMGYTCGTYLLWAYSAASHSAASHGAASSQAAMGTADVLTKARLDIKHLLEAYMEKHEGFSEEGKRKELMNNVTLVCGATLVLLPNVRSLAVMVTLTEEDKVSAVKLGTKLMKEHKAVCTVEDLYSSTAL